MRLTTKNSVDVETEIRIVDETAGTPETAVVAATPGFALWYRRDGEARVDLGALNDLAGLNSPHNDKGIKHKGDGYYRIDMPDAAFAAGSTGVTIGGTATGMVVIGNYHQITDVNLNDGVRAGLLALPNAQPAANGGLPTVNASNQIAGMQAAGVASIADALWDELRAGHVVAGSFGEALDAQISTRSTPSDVTSALNTYDPPTRAESATDRDQVVLAVNQNAALIFDAIAGCATPIDVVSAINGYDPPTRAELASDRDSIIAQVGTRAARADVDAALVAYDGPTRAELAADRDALVTEVDANEAKIDALGSMISANVNVTLGPLVAVHNPGNRIGSPATLEVFQAEAKVFAISSKDASGNLVSLTGVTLRFVVHDTNAPTAGVFDVESGSISITGENDTVALVPVGESQSNVVADDYRWILWDVVAKTALAHGLFRVLPAIFDVS